MLKIGYRYTANRMAMVARQDGAMAGAIAGIEFVASELGKLPRLITMLITRGPNAVLAKHRAPINVEMISRSLARIGVEPKDYCVDVSGFRQHVARGFYPDNYAAGPMLEGGAREQKLLEYYVSLDFLDADAASVVIDVASEWSLFPEVLHTLTGATVYQQDLIYRPGIHGTRIGGSAAAMPVPDSFADALVLHNAFEHFEGTADTDFIREAWRVLKPGGRLCILPLFMANEHVILTDPLSNRRGIVFDPGARIIEATWVHNRFGRFYDAAALKRRVLDPAHAAGFEATIYRITNLREVHPRVYLQFFLVLRKPTTS